MPILSNNRQWWTYFGVLFLTAALLLWISPVEHSLGSGIKSVYVHVALTWTGMTVLILAGILGMVVGFTGHPVLHVWLQALGRVGMLFYALGFTASLLSAKINWGAVFWAEPRVQASLKVVVAFGLVLLLAPVLPERHRGWLYGLLAGFMVISVYRAALVMHPKNPIGLSTSVAIQLTFIGLYLLALMLALLLTAVFRQRALGRKTGPS